LRLNCNWFKSFHFSTINLSNFPFQIGFFLSFHACFVCVLFSPISFLFSRKQSKVTIFHFIQGIIFYVPNLSGFEGSKFCVLQKFLPILSLLLFFFAAVNRTVLSRFDSQKPFFYYLIENSYELL
jgi:hypothetical protein